MKTIERLPFTIYDVIGYLAPGSFAVWISLLAAKHLKLHQTLGISHNSIFIFNNTYIDAIILISAFITASYITGYIISFLSAIIVERLLIRSAGYPTASLMGFRDEIEKKEKDAVYCISNIIMLIFMNTTFIVVFITKKTKLFTYLNEKLPNNIIKKTKERYKLINNKNKIKEKENWFNLIENYIKNNHQDAYLRMYNYVVIYGFLRSFCLLFNIIFIKFSIYFIYKCISLDLKQYELIWMISFLLFIAFISLVLFHAYVKFFRRYSKEGLTAFATLEPFPTKSD